MRKQGVGNSIDFLSEKNKWLTYLVFFLLTFLTILVGWDKVRVSRLEAKVANGPTEYVTLERYRTDIDRIEGYLVRLVDSVNRISSRPCSDHTHDGKD